MKKLRAWILVGALVSASAVGCGPKPLGAFDAQGYKNSDYGFRVAGDESLLGDEWQIDNLYRSGSKLLPKKTEEYLARYALDMDGDGVTDKTVETLRYDLRYKHLRRDALVWLRSFPLSSDLRGKDLRVLVQRYVDEVSGAGYEAVTLEQGTTIVHEKRFAAEVLSRGSFTIAEQEAYSATFDVANVDEIAVSPNARRTRVRIVLLRTPYSYKVYRADRSLRAEYPVFILAGYANLPEDFDKDEPAFRGLLERVDIAGKTGVTALALDDTASSAGDSAAGKTKPAPAAPAASGEATPAAPSATPPAGAAPGTAAPSDAAPGNAAPSATPPAPAPSATPPAPPARK